MRVRLTQIDGKLPNLALMKLSHWHKANLDEVYFTRSHVRELFEGDFDAVYASSIFKFSTPAQDAFRQEFPDAILGGTGYGLNNTVEELIGQEWEKYDYSIYPDFNNSLGFTQRGCRLNCGFCVVPKKEGRPRSVNSILDIWRKDPFPKNICLLDNDFFGQDKNEWMARIDELRIGEFKVCFNQGLNVRLLDEESCRALASVKYYDDQFEKRRIYTAWDNLKDEKIFFRGLNLMRSAGINPKHIMVYMLVGFDPEETMERIMYRFCKMVEFGVLPYPMVFDRKNKELCAFQRWVVRGYYRFVKWEDYGKKEEQ